MSYPERGVYHYSMFPRRCRERLVRNVSSWIKSFVSLTGPHLTVKVFSTKRALAERGKRRRSACRTCDRRQCDRLTSVVQHVRSTRLCSLVSHDDNTGWLYTHYWEAHRSSRERAASEACTVLPAELQLQRAPGPAESSACCQHCALV